MHSARTVRRRGRRALRRSRRVPAARRAGGAGARSPTVRVSADAPGGPTSRRRAGHAGRDLGDLEATGAKLDLRRSAGARRTRTPSRARCTSRSTRPTRSISCPSARPRASLCTSASRSRRCACRCALRRSAAKRRECSWSSTARRSACARTSLGELDGQLYLDPTLGRGSKVVLEGRALLTDGDAVAARSDAATTVRCATRSRSS